MILASPADQGGAALSETVSTTRIARLAGGIFLLALPAILLNGVVATATGLYPLAEGPHPYFVPAHAGLLYFLVPLAVVSASVLFLAPGLLLSLALGRGATAAQWLLSALAISLVGVSAVAGLVTGVIGRPVTGGRFGLTCLALTAGCAAVLAWRARRVPLAWPLANRETRFILALSLAVPFVLAAALAPKFLWESFNGDGAHAFEASRLLLRNAVSFWPAGAGDIAHFPGVTSALFTYPNAWYLRLFGEVEAAVRFPFLLHLTVLCAAILALAEQRAPLSPRLVTVVWTTLLAFALAMMFSATYDPYSADVALPATQDALLMVCFLGWVYSLLRREWGWLTLFTALSYTASPSGLLLIGFGLLAVPLVLRPRSLGWLVPAAFALLACMVAGGLLPGLLDALGAPRPGQEHGPLGILRYFAFLQFTDWRRLGLVLIPCGIIPAIGLFFWRRQDPGTRLVTLVALGYFLFFFFLAHISLHHFVPVMILPVVVAARLWSSDTSSARTWRAAWQVGAAAAVLLSLPGSYALADGRRRVGEAITETVGGYAESAPQVLRATTLLHALFPYDWESSVPDSSYGGSPLAWNRYARRGPITEATNYVLTRLESPAPEGMRLVASDSGAALYIRSDSVWRVHRAMRPPTPPGSRVYDIPRGILFHRPWPLAEGPHIIDVVATLKGAGIDVVPFLTRLGVR
jgi:hypothetical protein